MLAEWQAPLPVTSSIRSRAAVQDAFRTLSFDLAGRSQGEIRNRPARQRSDQKNMSTDHLDGGNTGSGGKAHLHG
jgi:hypothetical protein